MKTDSDASAKLALLKAAQTLFARDGFEKVSMRALTQEAGVNLASVNYHFGSKQGLIDAVIAGYINPVNEARLASLDRAEEAAQEAPIDLEVLLDCFMRPVLEAVRRSDMAERLFFQLMGRCMMDPCLKALPESVLSTFQEVVTRFPRAIHRSLPHLSEEEIMWRLHFTIGVLVHVLSHTDGLLHLAGGKLEKPPFGKIMAMVKSYCQAGLLAPSGADGVREDRGS